MTAAAGDVTDRIDLAGALWRDGDLGGWGRGRERYIAMPGRDDVRQRRQPRRQPR